MFVQRIFYGVKCDKCGIQYEEGEYSYWWAEYESIESAKDEGWIEKDDKHYCQDCHEVEDEENQPEKIGSV